MGKKSDPPPPPDYTGAAEKQAQGSQDTAVYNAWLNRPTTNTPWGSQSWESSAAIDPSTGKPVTKWEQNITLSPEQQAAQQAQMDITQGRSEAAKTLLGQATEGFKTPFDWEGMPAAPGSVGEAQQSAYEKMSAMLEPGRGRARSALDTKLANMGLSMGTEAAKRAQEGLGSQFTQQDQAMLAQAMGEGRQDIQSQQGLRSAAIAEQAQRRGMGLNELNALLTGQQVNMPQMPGFAQAGGAQGPQYMNAAQMQGDAAMQAAQMKQAGQMDWGQLAGTARHGRDDDVMLATTVLDLVNTMPLPRFSGHAAFVAYLKFAHGIMLGSVPLMKFAAERASGALREYYLAHASEEDDHARWMEEDLKTLGETPAKIDHAVAATTGAQYYYLQHVGLRRSSATWRRWSFARCRSMRSRRWRRSTARCRCARCATTPKTTRSTRRILRASSTSTRNSPTSSATARSSPRRCSPSISTTESKVPNDR